MSDQTFQEAYRRVRSRYDDDSWVSLHPRQITDAIYQEIKLLDAEHARTTQVAKTSVTEPQDLKRRATA